jgi:ketosteroid isomerase-like protein
MDGPGYAPANGGGRREQQMGEGDNRAAIDRYLKAFESKDMTILDEVYADDAVQEWPQSGERIVGKANIRAINENYPGLPAATTRRISGSGDLWTVETTLDYGGEVYNAVSVLEFRGGKIVRETDYFASPFPPPEWRAQWVQRS